MTLWACLRRSTLLRLLPLTEEQKCPFLSRSSDRMASSAQHHAHQHAHREPDRHRREGSLRRDHGEPAPSAARSARRCKQKFPLRTGETTFPFLQHFIRSLKAGGRAGIVIKTVRSRPKWEIRPECAQADEMPHLPRCAQRCCCISGTPESFGAPPRTEETRGRL